MPTVSSVDYVNKRIYLSVETVGVPLDTMQVYKDVRALRVSTENHRKFKPIIVGGGNIQKTLTTFTQPYVQLLYGCRIVPYNSAQTLVVTRDTFTDDGLAGVACFDRSSVASEVDIDYQVSPVEVREITVGGGAGPAGPTASAIASAVWAKVVEDGMSAEEIMRIILAVQAGNATALEGATPEFRSADGTKVRVGATYVAGTRTVNVKDGT